MGLVLLVRHGQASWGTADYDVLSELGHRQAELLGAAFASRGIVPDRVVTGGLRRHRETAATCAAAAGWAVGGTGIRAAVDPDWNEFDHEVLLAAYRPPHDGELTRAEFQAWFEQATGRWSEGAHQGEDVESFGCFTGRVERALDGLAAVRGTTVVFTSGGPVAWVAARLLAGSGTATGLWHRLNPVCVNSGVTRVVNGRRGTTLVSFNEHGHLDAHPEVLSYR